MERVYDIKDIMRCVFFALAAVAVPEVMEDNGGVIDYFQTLLTYVGIAFFVMIVAVPKRD